jgi:chemotaxis protein methyltransferase CheR
LIVCRNVFIYFDNQKIAQLMQKLESSLIPGGYLLLGASDPIDIKSTTLIFHHKEGILFSRPVENLQPVRTSVHAPIKTKPLPVSPKQKVLIDTKIKITVDEEQINQYLNHANWQEALISIGKYDVLLEQSSFLLGAKATVLANLGKLEEAIILFQKSLALDPANKNCYFTYAMALSELNKLDQAEAALRKTLFLDHEFVLGHYQLGLLLLRNKQINNGLKCLKNALAIAKSKDRSQRVPGPQELSYGRLADILGYEFELYSS